LFPRLANTRDFGRPRRLAVVGALLLWALSSLASAEPGHGIGQMDHTRWTVRDGLPGQVVALAQTPDGFLWLGTGNSLYRFDGVRFERHRSVGGEALPTVSALEVDRDGALWIGLRLGGLRRLKDGQLTAYGPDQGVPATHVRDLATTPDGELLVIVDGALGVLRDGRWQAIALEHDGREPDPKRLFVDRRGGVWVAGHRLWHRAAGEAAFRPSAGANARVRAFAQAPDGQVWAAETSPGRMRPLAPADGGPSPAIVVSATALLFDSEGGLWIGTAGEGVRYLPPGAEPDVDGLQSFTAADGLSADFLDQVLQDREGNLWFGSTTGLDRFRRVDLMDAGLPGGTHNVALAVSGDGALWAGALNRPAARLAGSQLRTLAVPPPITAAHTDGNGTVWLAEPNGIWRSDGEAARRVATLPPEVGGDAVVRALAFDRGGTLWVSINRHGLYRWRDGLWTREAALSHGPTQVMPVIAALDAERRPWFGYRDNLLVTVDGDGTRRWSDVDGLQVGHVTSLHPAEGGIWIGGSRGLAFFDGRAFRPITPVRGSRFSGLHGLVETVTGELWLHGDDGILRIPAEEVRRARAEPGFPVRPRSLGPFASLASDTLQLRPLPTAVEGRDGRVWFAVSNGVRVADPRRLSAPLPAPRPRILSLEVDDRATPLQPDTALPPHTRRIAIQYTAPGLTAPNQLRFRYRLQGYDTQWHPVGTRREAIYTALPPGRYRFEVSAAYAGGAWHSQGDALDFVQVPAIHQTGWFLAACIILGLGALWLLMWLRVRSVAAALRGRLEERHRERERIARELHDTLLQGVQGLMLRIQAATDRIAPGDPARHALEAALDQADLVIAEGRDRVKDLRGEEATDIDLLSALLAAGRELEPDSGTRLRAISGGKPRPLDPCVQEELYRIGREALINAFRHAGAREVVVEITHGRRALHLRVHDDGRGMSPEVIERGGRPGHWGLSGMRERAERIGGTFSIRSREGKGTEIDVAVPWAAGAGIGSARWWPWTTDRA
jgi:signal transduction histidine kinase/ligand-binding sensor domain-containing protein